MGPGNIFASSVVQCCEPVWTAASGSCSQLTGVAPSVVSAAVDQLLHKPDRWPCGKIPADQQFQKHSRFSLLSPSSFWCSVWRPCSILLTELCSVLVRRCNYSWCSHVSRVCMKSDWLSEFGVFVGQTFAKVTLMKSASDQDESFVLTDGLTRVSLSFGAFSIKINSAVLMQWAVKVILNWGCLVSQNQCRVKGLLTTWVLQPSVAPRSLNILKSFLKAMKVFWFQLQESCVRSCHKGQKCFKSSHVSPPNHKLWVLIESQVRLTGLFFSSQLLEASLPRSFCHEGSFHPHACSSGIFSLTAKVSNHQQCQSSAADMDYSWCRF